jgi:hypothetical protein
MLIHSLPDLNHATLLAAHAAQRAKKSTGVHATLVRLPLPHRYAEAVLSEGGL